MQYWFRGTGDTKDPFDHLQIRGLAATQQLTPSMELSSDGVTWHAANKVDGLFPKAAPKPILDFASPTADSGNLIPAPIPPTAAPVSAYQRDPLSSPTLWNGGRRPVTGDHPRLGPPFARRRCLGIKGPQGRRLVGTGTLCCEPSTRGHRCIPHAIVAQCRRHRTVRNSYHPAMNRRDSTKQNDRQDGSFRRGSVLTRIYDAHLALLAHCSSDLR